MSMRLGSLFLFADLVSAIVRSLLSISKALRNAICSAFAGFEKPSSI